VFAPTNWPPEEGAGAAEEAAAGAAGRLLRSWYRRPRPGLWQQ